MERRRVGGFGQVTASFGTESVHRDLQQTENDAAIITGKSHRTRAVLEVRVLVHKTVFFRIERPLPEGKRHYHR